MFKVLYPLPELRASKYQKMDTPNKPKEHVKKVYYEHPIYKNKLIRNNIIERNEYEY